MKKMRLLSILLLAGLVLIAGAGRRAQVSQEQSAEREELYRRLNLGVAYMEQYKHEEAVKQFGLTIAAAVFMSLLVARLITPLLAAYFLRDHGPDHSHEGPVMRGYTRLVRWSVRHKYITLVLGLACFVASIMSTGLLPAGFLPADPPGRQRVRALAQAIAMDIHPVCNLGVVGHVMELTGRGEAARAEWMVKFIGEGLSAVERMLEDPRTGTFCHGEGPSIADFCLVPQVYNADRWGVDMSRFSRIRSIAAVCEALPAFQAAHPERVKPH